MLANLSIFLDFNLPKATTWFYFSFLLAVALFFKFGRLLSIRNLDVVTLFLLVPGLLVIHGSRPGSGPAVEHPACYSTQPVFPLTGEASAGTSTACWGRWTEPTSIWSWCASAPTPSATHGYSTTRP